MSQFFRLYLYILGLTAGSLLLGQAVPKPAPKAKKSASTVGTEFEFEGTTVKGDKAAGMGSLLEQASPDQSYDFVTIRGNWRKEMIKSADTLDTQVSPLNLEND